MGRLGRWMTVGGLGVAVTMTGCVATGDLGGTSWAVAEVITVGDEPPVLDMDISFSKDGWVTTNYVEEDGTRESRRRPYRVKEALVVVTRPEGEFNLLHRIDGDTMYVVSESFHARLLKQ